MVTWFVKTGILQCRLDLISHIGSVVAKKHGAFQRANTRQRSCNLSLTFIGRLNFAA